MRKRLWLLLPIVVIVILFVVLYKLSLGHNMAIFSPTGKIAHEQRNLIYTASALMALILIPVYYLIFTIAWRFHEDNKGADYTPDWDNNRLLETIWWGIPCIIIGILVVITWNSTHALDPYRPIASDKKPLKVQVVALQWKWLFIYPEQGVASLNSLQIPVDRPIDFEITADAPMNSFWIPQLGGQIYAMAGMSTQLHLIADQTGNYRGSSANLSGEGFSDMNFMAHALSSDDFNNWVAKTKDSKNVLNQTVYDHIAMPNTLNKPIFYGKVSSDLYDTVIMKYMMPMGSDTEKHMADMPGMVHHAH